MRLILFFVLTLAVATGLAWFWEQEIQKPEISATLATPENPSEFATDSTDGEQANLKISRQLSGVGTKTDPKQGLTALVEKRWVPYLMMLLVAVFGLVAGYLANPRKSTGEDPKNPSQPVDAPDALKKTEQEVQDLNEQIQTLEQELAASTAQLAELTTVQTQSRLGLQNAEESSHTQTVFISEAFSKLVELNHKFDDLPVASDMETESEATPTLDLNSSHEELLKSLGELEKRVPPEGIVPALDQQGDTAAETQIKNLTDEVTALKTRLETRDGDYEKLAEQFEQADQQDEIRFNQIAALADKAEVVQSHIELGLDVSEPLLPLPEADLETSWIQLETQLENLARKHQELGSQTKELIEQTTQNRETALESTQARDATLLQLSVLQEQLDDANSEIKRLQNDPQVDETDTPPPHSNELRVSNRLQAANMRLAELRIKLRVHDAPVTMARLSSALDEPDLDTLETEIFRSRTSSESKSPDAYAKECIELRTALMTSQKDGQKLVKALAASRKEITVARMALKRAQDQASQNKEMTGTQDATFLRMLTTLNQANDKLSVLNVDVSEEPAMDLVNEFVDMDAPLAELEQLLSSNPGGSSSDSTLAETVEKQEVTINRLRRGIEQLRHYQTKVKNWENTLSSFRTDIKQKSTIIDQLRDENTELVKIQKSMGDRDKSVATLVTALKHEGTNIRKLKKRLSRWKHRCVLLEKRLLADLSNREPIADSNSMGATQLGELLSKTDKDRPISDTPTWVRGQASTTVFDDLSRVEGIDDVLAESLFQVGVNSVEQLAEFSDADVEWLAYLLDMYPSKIRKQKWVEQAKQLLQTTSKDETATKSA